MRDKVCVPIGMQNASPEPLAAGDAFCIRRWASAEIQACTGGRPYATITGGRDEEMPDDYFNRQQNQHKPRYAAGSDMDSIKTGREIPEGGFKGKRSGPSAKSVLLLLTWVCICTIAIAAYVDSKEQKEKTTTTAPNNSATQVSSPKALQKTVTGEVSKDLVSFFYARDNSKATVEAYITNGTNKTIYNITVTYTIKDTAENVLAEKTISVPSELASGETGDYTTVIETPSKPTGETKVWMYATYKIRYT